MSVDGLPGSDIVTPYWAREVRVPLEGLTSIAKLDLIPRTSSGSALLIDAWGWQAGLPAPRPVALPRVDIGGRAVEEGDSGGRTYQIPVTITGRGDGQVRVFLIDGLTYETKSWVARIRPGTRTIPVPVTVAGDTLYGGETQYLVVMKAILSEPAETSIYVYGEVQPPGTARELSSTDVDPEWFMQTSGEDPEPSRPLSETDLFPDTEVLAGDLTGDLTVPTISDNLAEPAEQVRLQLYSSTAEEPIGSVTGTVTG